MNDLRAALRRLRKSPGLSAAAIVTLALGIGATTALFTVVNGILLRPLPYPDPDRLVTLHSAYPDRGVDRGTLSLPDFRDWSGRSRTVPTMGLYSLTPADLVLQADAGARELHTAYISWGFFRTLGIAPFLGRVFREEDETGNSRAVVVSHQFWRQHLGGDSAAVGRSMTLSDQQFEVIGVMPPGFGFPDPDLEAWALLVTVPPTSIPLHLRFVRILNAVGRLAPGVTPDQAGSELSAVASALSQEHPDANEGLTAASVVPLRTVVVGEVQRALWILLGAVGFVLLIACVNVANLLLARGVGRTREIAIRRALGAERSRIVRMLLTEGLILALIGGAAGTTLAFWSLEALRVIDPGILPRVGEVRPDLVVLGVAVLISLLTVLVFGLYPALVAARPVPGVQLRQWERGSSGAGFRSRGGLVAAEVAIALVLLIGAGLLARSFWTLRQVDPGFQPAGALAVTLIIPQSRYPERADYLPAHDRLLERFRQLPGVVAAGSIRHAPMRGGGEQYDYTVPGEPERPASERREARVLQVTPDVFRALGVPLLRGRTVSADDPPGGPPVVVVNQAFTRITFPGQDPVGKTIRIGSTEITIVGEVGDVRQQGLDAPAVPTFYVPIQQIPRRAMSFVIRTSADPLALANPVREAGRQVDPDQAIAELATLEDLIQGSVARPRFFTLLLGAFAALALVLSAVGVYGVLAFTVRRRTREIGIRMALGADHRRTMGLVIRQGMRPVLAGLALGAGAAWLLTRFLAGLLFEVRPFDPVTYLAVMLLLSAVALGACWVPGRRAVRIAPMEALRDE